MGGTAVISKSSWMRASALLAAGVGSAWATPDDDYRRGLEAFHRGDVATAMTVLRAPADAHHVPSQTLLAFILDKADFPEQAARLYRDAAAQGDAEAHSGLGNLYLAGRGIAKDEKQAVLHFSKAAELGHAPSIRALADAYLSGQMGLRHEPRDNPRAATVLKQAAEQGHVSAAQALALAYRNGDWGLAADATQAARWQAKATELSKQRSGPVPAKAKP